MDLHLAAGWDRIKKTKKERKILNARNYQKELEKLIADLTKQMKKAAAELNFEAAAELRDKLVELKKMLNDME